VRRSKKQDDQSVLLAAGVLAFGVVITVVQWLVAHWWILFLAAVVAAAAGGLWLQQARQRAEWERVRARALRLRIAELDALDHRAFEFAVRDLMRRDCCRAEQLGGAGDNACDVRAVDPMGRVWAIQCKHRRDGDRGSAVGCLWASDKDDATGYEPRTPAGDIALDAGREWLTRLSDAKQRGLSPSEALCELSAWQGDSRSGSVVAGSPQRASTLEDLQDLSGRE
jgi:hypothetical protein